MKFSLIVYSLQVRRALAAAVAAVLIACTAGCASPGQPHPPSLNLPEVVKDLTTERVGDVVELQWTTPEKTTDRLDVKGVMTAEVCRIVVASSSSSSAAAAAASSSSSSSGCVPVVRLAVQPGATRAAEALPPALTVDPPALLAYRVQILNAHGRSAGSSREAFAAAGVAPPGVEQLRAMATAEGATLEWQKRDTTAVVELDRVPVGANGVAVEPAAAKRAPKASSKPLIKKQTAGKQTGLEKPGAAGSTPKVQESPSAPVEVKLRTPAELADAGGTIDHTAQMRESYRYTARRVRTVTLDGHRLELGSVASGPVTLVVRNMFPPHAPAGLEAAPGGEGAGERSIDLSWTPNTERDLAGYIVYRQEIDAKGVAAGTATRLNPTPVAGPAYRDQTAVAGRRYAYFVTAINAAGNESAPSEAVQETLREQ